MTPKEKAEELVNKYKLICDRELNNSGNIALAQEYALIAVDEVIEAIEWHEYETPNKEIRFWMEVKQEIEKL
jgi:hypothetical protein